MARQPKFTGAELVKNDLTQKELRRILSYDPETGIFRHLRDVRIAGISKGDIAGSLDKDGYVIIGARGKVYRAHRLAWLYVHGQWPEHEIDHRNGVPGDNWINNLREAEGPRQQQQNQKLSDSNTSGYVGVYWSKYNRRWYAMIRNGGKKMSLGSFTCRHKAGEAYLEAKARLHKFQPVPRHLLVAGGAG